MRPPSRHKTPPKAVGLELPPKRIIGDLIPVDQMFQQDSPLSDLENESFSNTMPINFNDTEKSRKKTRESPNDSAELKYRSKPKSAKGKAPEKISMRMWSAASKPKNKMMDVPIIINKKEKNNISFSRRDKQKNDEEKKEQIFEEKRKTYFNKANDKRAQSSSKKTKLNMILPFQSSLEPEFLNLFAKGEEFNF